MIKAYLNKTITFHSATRDKWGAVTYVDTPIAARIEEKTKLLRSTSGEQTVSNAQVLIEDRTVTHLDKVTVLGVKRSIISIVKDTDFSNIALWLYLT